MSVEITPLGQSGFHLNCNGVSIFIDPYLTDAVAASEGPAFRRMVQVPVHPADIRDADWVLITHHHGDHYDPDTIGPLSKSSPACQFICPNSVVKDLESQLDKERIVIAECTWLEITEGIRVLPVVAAHPEIEYDELGFSKWVGYVIECDDTRIYHSGDTSPHEDIIDSLRPLSIDIAMLPVNEKSWFREQMGIIGNMSVREAFQMAEEIGVKQFIPMHWDMFSPNSVYPEEINLLYQKIRPPFQMNLMHVEKLDKKL